MKSPWKGYDAGPIMPLGGYATLLGAWGAAAVGVGAALKGRLPRRIGTRDLVLGGLATHKLTRVVTHDWVTAPMRAPFVTFKKAKSGGEVVESSRGGPLRRAVGDLLTCPYCSGPWIGGALLAGLVLKPKATRAFAALFGMVAVSDFLHRAYEALSTRVDVMRRSAEA